jgi:regulatory protein
MKKLTKQEANAKIQHYCAYQERSHQEVRNRLYEYGLFREEVDELLTNLITEGFLNEDRFAKAYAGGKFRIKKWGRLKIINELEAKGLSKNCIRSGLKEIDENHYVETLRNILIVKSDQLNEEPNRFVRRDKTSRYAIQKGYEPELVWKILREIIPD